MTLIRLALATGVLLWPGAVVARALGLRGASVTLAWSLTLLFWLTWAATVVMLAGERRVFYPVTWFRLVRWSISLAFEILPTQLSSALPGHHPRSLVDPIYLPAWLAHFDPATGTLPLWEDAAA